MTFCNRPSRSSGVPPVVVPAWRIKVEQVAEEGHRATGRAVHRLGGQQLLGHVGYPGFGDAQVVVMARPWSCDHA
jgi:hypothetical protein